MAFLTPLFLAGLAALGVPLLIHMIQRQRTEVVEFPSLMFVRRIPFHSLRRQRIRHWFLLLLRCAALALLVAAFARPFVRSAALAAVGGGAREVVILLDRSYSMGYGDRWDRAREAARSVVQNLVAGDRATLVLFDSGVQAGAPSTTDQASLLAAIDGAEISAGTTRFGPALQFAQGILEDSDQPLLEAVLVSDFQQIGVDSAANIRMPAGTVVTPVSVGQIPEDETENVILMDASVQRDMFANQERAVVTARLANRGDASVDNLLVSLELNGYELESQPVTIEANSSATATFAPFALEDRAIPVSVRTAADALVHDNVFHFTVSPADVVSVLVIVGLGESDASLYLEQALGIGSSPLFRTAVRSVEDVTVEDVRAASVVILNDVGLPSDPVGEEISQFVSEGGGLWAVLGERVRWPGDRLDLLPGSLEGPVEREGRGGVLSFIDYSHPVFSVFSTPRSGDLTTPRFFRYRPIDVTPSASVIARFDNGDAAMVEHNVGAGRVLAWTSTIDSFWNDFALKSIYLPFVHKVVEYLAQYQPALPFLTAGQVLDLAQYPEAAEFNLSGGNIVVRDPDEDRVPVGGLDDDTRVGFVQLTEQGFYEIRDTAGGDGMSMRVAVNVDRDESNLAQADPQELVGIVTGRASGEGSAVAAREFKPEDLEQRQRLWWYFLIGAFGCLFAETVVSNRLSRTELNPDE